MEYFIEQWKQFTGPSTPPFKKGQILIGTLAVLWAMIAIYDGFNGRNCGRNLSLQDPVSFGASAGCFVRGFMEQAPRAKGWEKGGSDRAN